MGAIGCGLSLVALVFALIGAIPFLGWLNWITTLPLALLAIFFGALGVTREDSRGAGALAVAGGVLLLFWALFRLGIGGGVV